jgi:hypothetical protein
MAMIGAGSVSICPTICSRLMPQTSSSLPRWPKSGARDGGAGHDDGRRQAARVARRASSHLQGNPVDFDPRERFIADCMAKRGDYNIFHAYYRELVLALHETGATRYVFCVHVDAIIASLLLTVLWKDYKSGVLAAKDLETAAFNVFLYGRMIGAAAEIDDHLNRGRNMHTRTQQEQCAFVV